MDLINLVNKFNFCVHATKSSKMQNLLFQDMVIFIQLELWKITENWEKWNKAYAYIELKLVKKPLIWNLTSVCLTYVFLIPQNPKNFHELQTKKH